MKKMDAATKKRVQKEIAKIGNEILVEVNLEAKSHDSTKDCEFGFDEHFDKASEILAKELRELGISPGRL